MDTTAKSEYSSKTMRDKHGNYPKWMSRKKVKQLKKTAKKKKMKKK